MYYGGLQFDSYFSNRFHYSLTALLYSIDLSSDYALEGNVRLTYYISPRVGISAACKAAYIRISEWIGQTTQPDGTFVNSYDKAPRISILPFIDLTLLINPDRGQIRHGLFKNRRKQR